MSLILLCVVSHECVSTDCILLVCKFSIDFVLFSLYFNVICNAELKYMSCDTDLFLHFRLKFIVCILLK